MYIYADRWLRHVWNGKTWPRIRRSDENKTSNNFHAASPTISRLCALCALCVCVWRVLKQWNGPDARILLFFGQLYSGQHKQYKLHFAFVSESKDAGIQCEQHGQSDDCKKLYYSAWLALVGGKQWIFWSRLAACCRFSPLNFLSVLLSTVFVVVVVNFAHRAEPWWRCVSCDIQSCTHTYFCVAVFVQSAVSSLRRQSKNKIFPSPLRRIFVGFIAFVMDCCFLCRRITICSACNWADGADQRSTQHHWPSILEFNFICTRLDRHEQYIYVATAKWSVQL